jgi:hypothetical protein
MTTPGARIALRWPLHPLLEACTHAAGRDPRRAVLTPGGFARWFGISGSAVLAAARDGLSDRQADQWATRAGYHPASIWGWDAWAGAALADNSEGVAA